MDSPSLYQGLKNISKYLDNKGKMSFSGAVAFLFVEGSLLLIKRSLNMASHRGEMAFIGGHREESDKSAIDTAYRELLEETGIDFKLEVADGPYSLECFGALPSLETLQGTRVVPIVFYTKLSSKKLLKEIKSNGEWVDAIVVDYKTLVNKDSWVSGQICGHNKKTDIYFRPLGRDELHGLKGNETNETGHVLWGLSAKIIWNFNQNYWSKYNGIYR